MKNYWLDRLKTCSIDVSNKYEKEFTITECTNICYFLINEDRKCFHAFKEDV